MNTIPLRLHIAWCRKELGHIRADHAARFLERYQESINCRGWAEVEAESIAYLVTAHAGLETDDYSVPYVATWANGDTDLLRETAARVVGVAGAMTKELTPRPGHGSADSSGRWLRIVPTSEQLGPQTPDLAV